MIIDINGHYAIECQTKAAIDCLQNSGYFDSKEETQESVEDECWIFTGEGWICINCNTHFMANLRKQRKDRGLDESDDDLFKGINTVR